MSLQRQADRPLALTQWETLYSFFVRELGLTVELIEPVRGLPDMVFTANAGIARGDMFISSHFRNKERAGESPHYEAWFKDRGYIVYTVPQGCFEGEGDVLFADPFNAFAGYLIRSDVSAHARVAELLGVRVVSLELVDPRFYHLDTCFCPLSADSVVYYPGAFDSYAREVIRENFADCIEVTEEEAGQFVCNAVVVGTHYVQAEGGRNNLRPALEDRGYTVHEFGMSEFIKAGGATKCLVLKLEKPPEVRKGYAA
ncbi:MAG: hypothetical protein Kow0099_12860 [Candidatus Abyssubacteria bacterium]